MWGKTSSEGRGNERFTARRRLRRRRALIAFGVLLIIGIGAGIYGLWQNAVRISHIEVFGGDPSLVTYATNAMQGSYFGIIPRDSIFFFPASSIRTDILSARSDIGAISLFRNGFTGLSIKVNDRVPIARLCGLAPTFGVEEYCYVFDANGYIFSVMATSTPTLNTFTLYAPLAGDTQEPLRATIAYAEKLPSVFDFARQLDTLGSRIAKVVVRDDEVDDYLVSGTRITYVLGHEQDAFTALVSAKGNLNLADGSLEYVDLRFDGKVYLKKKTSQ